MPSRRTVVARVGTVVARVGTVVGLGGYSALASPSARVTRTRLQNYDAVAREFDLTVSVDGEPDYEGTHELAPDEEDGSMHELTDELPNDAGELVVQSAIAGTEFTESSTYTDDGCYDLIVEFTGEDLIHWKNTDKDRCE